MDGKCCRISSQVREEAGRVPSCASVACPEKLMTSTTFQVVPATGASMVAVVGVLPTLMVTESVSLAPASDRAGD